MPQIFVSYSSVDRSRVEPLVAALQQSGWSVFWDGDILPAENWHQKIASELEAAACTIVLWTKNSVRSYWVIEEAMYSRQRGVLLPVTLEDVSPPPGFLSLQCVDLSRWHGDRADRAYTRLADAITQHAGQPADMPPASETLNAGEVPGPQSSAPTASATPDPPPETPHAVTHVYEGESIPWLNWSALLLALLFMSFQDRLLKVLASYSQGLLAESTLRSSLLPIALAFVVIAFRPILWDARKLNTKEVTAVFVIASLAVFQLLGAAFAAGDVRIATLQPTESGQLVASVVIIVLAVVVWLARDYQKSWLEVGFLWLVVCAAIVIISVFSALIYYGNAPVGFGRLYPRGTGLLVGAALIVVSTAVLVISKFRHMSAIELGFYWLFGCIGLTSFARILSIAWYGRAFELENLAGTLTGFALALAIGVILLGLRLARRGTSSPAT